MKKVTPTIQKILDMNGTAWSLDVVYDTDDDIKYQDKRAKKFGVKCDRNLESYPQQETITGKVSGILKYLNDYNKADYGYQCGLALEIKLKSSDVDAFNEFVNWMTASYADFKEGILENDDMKKFIK